MIGLGHLTKQICTCSSESNMVAEVCMYNKNLPTYVCEHDYTSYAANTFFCVSTVLQQYVDPCIYPFCFVQLLSHALVY